MFRSVRALCLAAATALAVILPDAVVHLAAQGQPSATPVDVTPVLSRAVSQTRSIAGELLPFESVAIHARASGYVRTVAVDRGSQVRRGQTLAALDAPEVLAARAEAEARLAAARSQQAEGRAKLVGLENTFGSLKAASATAGAVSANELVQAEQAVVAQQALMTALESQTAAAGAAVEAVRQQERYLTIVAPFDGVITERNVHPGALVGPQGGAASPPLFRLEQTRRLRLVVAVPEAGLGVITRGAPVEFTVPAHPGVAFSAPVARVAGSVDPRTRTMAVELDVNNTDGRLAPGMYPSVRWPLQRDAASLLVPRTSVVTTTERVFVVRVRGGRAEWVNVTRGATEGDLVEVLGELKAGDEVLVRGTDEIRPGQAVRTRGKTEGRS
jgi:RND family efflux transporter MFP subunit